MRFLLLILMVACFSFTSYSQSETIFYDSFNNNANDWSTSTGAERDFSIKNGRYYLNHKRDKSGWNSHRSVTINTNRDFEIEASIYKVSGVTGYGYGIVFGRKDNENYYSYNITSNGYYRIAKNTNDNWETIVDWKQSSAIKTGNGMTNKLSIQKQGSQIKFYANGTYLYGMSFQEFFGDRVGFVLYNNQQIAIDYLKVSYLSGGTTTTTITDNDAYFLDNFSNNYNGWSTVNYATKVSSVRSGKYYIRHKAESGGFHTSISKSIDTRRDFEIETKIDHVGGVEDYGYGVVFGKSTEADFQSFNITATGFYRVGMNEGGTWSNLKEWTKSDYVKTGMSASNILKIVKKGYSMKFYVNGNYLYTMDFKDFAGSQLGFVAYNDQEVAVDYIKVKYTSTGTVVVDDTKKSSIFHEDFRDNSNDWPDKSDSHEKAGFDLKNGKYYFAHKQDSYSWIVSKGITINTYKDFEIKARIQKVSGVQNSGFGMVWGRKDSDNQHEFVISANGSYKIGKWQDGEWVSIQKWTNSGAINEGNYAYNELKIVKKGSSYNFYINDSYVHKYPFQSPPGDRIGFMMYNNQEIAVDYLYVSYLEEKEEIFNEPPTIVITEPAVTRGFDIVQSTDVRVAGKASDIDGISSVRVNGKTAIVNSDGSFYTNVSVGSNGLQSITVIAQDRKGATATETFKVQLKAYSEKRLALLIGNSNYSFGGSLRNPTNDARSMESALKELGFTVMKYENCDQRTMKRAIDEFGVKLQNYDVGLFFYAGHGVQVNGLNYLVPINAQLTAEGDVEYDCVRADRVMAKMETANANTNIIILDACRDNPFERSWSRSTNGKGLAFMNAPSGSLIAYATSPGNTASDGQGQNGLYTEQLLRHIKTPNMSIEEIFKKVRTGVIENSGGKQTPWESTSLTGDFFFKRQ